MLVPALEYADNSPVRGMASLDLVPRRQDALLGGASGYESLMPAKIRSLLGDADNRFNALLDLANVKCLLTQHPIELPLDHFESIINLEGSCLYHNTRCLPRAQFIAEWRVIPDQRQQMDLMASTEFDTREVVFLDREPPPGLAGPPARDGNPEPQAAVQMLHYGATRAVVHVHCPQKGVLLPADTFYPVWRAFGDGRPTSLCRADGALKAVFVHAGEHEIKFEYRPLTFRVHATLASATVATSALVALGRLLVFIKEGRG